jgi:hypothetical protein
MHRFAQVMHRCQLGVRGLPLRRESAVLRHVQSSAQCTRRAIAAWLLQSAGSMLTRANRSLSSVLCDLEAAAYDVAKGQSVDAPALVSAIDTRALRGGAPLLTVLRATAPRVSLSPTARRQFFHAARALIALHRAA